jgi:branched-chain amino acid transport system substrate-binding protein
MKIKFIAITVAVTMIAPPVMAETLKIGFINTFSGGAAIYGKHQKDALELALDHKGRKIGGLDVEVIYGDDQRKPDVGRQVAAKMLKKDKVHVVSGIIWSNILAAVQKMVVRDKTFMITTNAGWSHMAGKGCNPYFFSTS